MTALTAEEQQTKRASPDQPKPAAREQLGRISGMTETARHSWTGTISAPVRARPTPAGKDRLEFSLREQGGEGTVEHHIYTLGAHARAIAKLQLTEGEPV